jgi:hypothetical protein
MKNKDLLCAMHNGEQLKKAHIAIFNKFTELTCFQQAWCRNIGINMPDVLKGLRHTFPM